MSPYQLDNLVLNYLTTACLLLDQQLRVKYANPAAENLLSISSSQLAGNSFTIFLTSDQAEQELRNALTNNISYTHRESTLHIPGNGQIIVDFTATSTHNQMLLIELNHMDRILHINREEQMRSVQTTSQEMVRGMAHEVKNPLGGIKGAAQLLAMELNDELKEFTDVIITEASRLSNLVDRLLGPAQPLNIENINIHEITEHVATLVESEAGHLITIHREYDPSIPDIDGDRDQLIQSVLNIARNAMQALTESDTPNATLTFLTRIQRNFTIGSQHHKMVCRVDIIDNGPGIDDAVADRIFFPMISGRASGSGLGLPIAQTIISRHEGLIKCTSQPGETRFSIFLPLTYNANSGANK